MVRKRAIVQERERQVVQEALFGSPPERIAQRVQLSPYRVGKILRCIGYIRNDQEADADAVPPKPVPASDCTPLQNAEITKKGALGLWRD